MNMDVKSEEVGKTTYAEGKFLIIYLKSIAKKSGGGWAQAETRDEGPFGVVC